MDVDSALTTMQSTAQSGSGIVIGIIVVLVGIGLAKKLLNKVARG